MADMLMSHRNCQILENVPKTALELVTLPSEDFMAGFHGPWRKACIATLFLQNDHATERR